MHGSISPSNICLDGRWIDLTLNQFIRSDENTAGFFPFIPSFYEELCAPLSFLGELLDNFNKYNGTELRIHALVNYYFSALDSAFNSHLGYLFGISRAAIDLKFQESALNTVKAEVMKLLSSGKTVLREWPITLPATDPMLAFLEATFSALTAKTGQAPPDAYSDAIHAIFDAAYDSAEGKKYYDRHAFLAASYISAFKRSAVIEYFFKGGLEHRTKVALKSGDIGRSQSLIKQSIDIGAWAFSENEVGNATLYRSPDLEVSYDCTQNLFSIRRPRAGINTVISSVKDLKHAINALGADDLSIHAFDFRPYLDRLLKTLTDILSRAAHERI